MHALWIDAGETGWRGGASWVGLRRVAPTGPRGPRAACAPAMPLERGAPLARTLASPPSQALTPHTLVPTPPAAHKQPRAHWPQNGQEHTSHGQAVAVVVAVAAAATMPLPRPRRGEQGPGRSAAFAAHASSAPMRGPRSTHRSSSRRCALPARRGGAWTLRLHRRRHAHTLSPSAPHARCSTASSAAAPPSRLSDHHLSVLAPASLAASSMAFFLPAAFCCCSQAG